MCRVCEDSLNVTSGIGVIKTYEKRPKHLNNLEKSKNQLQFVANKKGSLSLETVDGGIFLTSEEQKWKAEILHALNLVDKNFSVQSCVCDNYLYPEMFPDSEVTKHYEMSSTKVMYIMRYGITKYFKDELTKEVKEKPFTFHFDESTTSQTKKQYDVMSNSFHWNLERF